MNDLTKTINKKIYKGTFNWKGEIHTLYTTALHKDHAYALLIPKLAKILGYNRAPLYAYFAHDKPNHEIEEIKKDD